MQLKSVSVRCFLSIPDLLLFEVIQMSQELQALISTNKPWSSHCDKVQKLAQPKTGLKTGKGFNFQSQTSWVPNPEELSLQFELAAVLGKAFLASSLSYPEIPEKYPSRRTRLYVLLYDLYDLKMRRSEIDWQQSGGGWAVWKANANQECKSQQTLIKPLRNNTQYSLPALKSFVLPLASAWTVKCCNIRKALRSVFSPVSKRANQTTKQCKLAAGRTCKSEGE